MGGGRGQVKFYPYLKKKRGGGMAENVFSHAEGGMGEQQVSGLF